MNDNKHNQQRTETNQNWNVKDRQTDKISCWLNAHTNTKFEDSSQEVNTNLLMDGQTDSLTK